MGCSPSKASGSKQSINTVSSGRTKIASTDDDVQSTEEDRKSPSRSAVEEDHGGVDIKTEKLGIVGKTPKYTKKDAESQANKTDNGQRKEHREDIGIESLRTVESGVVNTGHGFNISLPHQSGESIEIDPRSVKQQIEEDKIKKETEKKQQEEEITREKEVGEKERKRIIKLKTSLGDNVGALRKKYRDRNIPYTSWTTAVEMLSNQLMKRERSEQKQNSIDQNKYKKNRLKIAKQEEKARLLHRLSELASERLRQNNPDIADLSDPNRATKLAERLSELYDNEWTDTFEATKKKMSCDDKLITEGLRDILKFCYESCQDITNKQQSAYFCLLNLNVKTDVQTSAPDLRLRVKEFQKNISQYSLLHVKKVVKEGAKHENNVVAKSLTKKNKYHSYIDLCTEIAWYMQIQDPPLVLNFDASASDTALFRPYTVSGQQIDYVLWPAMLLHEGGPLVAKGVAQFRKQPDDDSVKQAEIGPRIKKNENAVIKTVDSDW